jgi:ribonuclease HI
MIIYCDGGSRGNPGPAAAAFVAYDNKNIKIYEDTKFLGTATNNTAEYNAVLLALEWLSENGTDDVQIVLDSELVQRQLTGRYKIKNQNLFNLANKAKELIKNFDFDISFTHTLRTGNSEADRLVNVCLDRQKP